MDSLNYEYPLDRDPRFLTGGFHPSFGDPTWKERHAKGVPVKMDQSEWMDECGKVMPSVSDILPWYGYHRHPIEGSITITTDYLSGKVAGSFCNFRYKPEWLEKKGQTNN